MKRCPSCNTECEDSKIYCHNCGGLLELVSQPQQVPESQTEQLQTKRKKPILWIVLFVCSLVVIVILGIAFAITVGDRDFYYESYRDYSKRYRDRDSEYYDLEKKYNRLESEYEDLDEYYDSLESQYKYLAESYDDLETENMKLQTKYKFFDKYVRVLADDESNIYHRYECSKLDRAKGFWIYNVDNAKTKASPCSDCCPDD